MPVWHDDPALKGHFHPDYPDDIQVIVHEGSLRFTATKPELMWARIGTKLEFVRTDGSIVQAYQAVLLNEPHNLKTLKAGQEIFFMAHLGYQHPIRVTRDYIGDRAQYDIVPCSGCGLPEAFDPISTLIEHSFPDLKGKIDNAHLPMFTSICPMCGQTLVVRHIGLKTSQSPSSAAAGIDFWTRVKKWIGRSSRSPRKQP